MAMTETAKTPAITVEALDAWLAARAAYVADRAAAGEAWFTAQ